MGVTTVASPPSWHRHRLHGLPRHRRRDFRRFPFHGAQQLGTAVPLGGAKGAGQRPG